jgi:putative ribosome biogenesis GTPase RsgA
MKVNKKVSEIINSVENLDNEFEDILELSMRCKFSNCTHTNESDCAVKKAISEGFLSEERFNNYYKFKNEAKYVSKQKNKTKAIDYMKQKKLFEKS